MGGFDSNMIYNLNSGRRTSNEGFRVKGAKHQLRHLDFFNINLNDLELKLKRLTLNEQFPETEIENIFLNSTLSRECRW